MSDNNQDDLVIENVEENVVTNVEQYPSGDNMLNKFLKVIKSNFFFILILVAIVVIRTYVISIEEIIGESMEPALQDGDLVITDNKLYKLTGINRFDIIVFDIPRNDEEFLYVKRVIGLPGETVEIKGGVLYINGEELEVDEDMAELNGLTYGFESGVIPEGSYFVLGDNRPVSLDSRYPEVGFVSEDIILGHVFFRHRPLNKFGPL